MGHYSLLGSFHCAESEVLPNQSDNLLSSCIYLFDGTLPCADIINKTRVQHGCFHMNFNGFWPIWGLIFSHFCDIFSTLFENPFKLYQIK